MGWQEFIAWLGALLGGGALVTVAKFWYDMGGRSRQIDQHETALTALTKRVDEIATRLGAHEIASERQFAKVEALAALEERFTDAIAGMRADFRDVSSRIDRLIEMAAKQH